MLYNLSIEIHKFSLALVRLLRISAMLLNMSLLMCAESPIYPRHRKYAREHTCVHTHTNTPVQIVVQMIGCDVIIENLFSEKDSSDYDQSQALLATLH